MIPLATLPTCHLPPNIFSLFASQSLTQHAIILLFTDGLLYYVLSSMGTDTILVCFTNIYLCVQYTWHSGWLINVNDLLNEWTNNRSLLVGRETVGLSDSWHKLQFLVIPSVTHNGYLRTSSWNASWKHWPFWEWKNPEAKYKMWHFSACCRECSGAWRDTMV